MYHELQIKTTVPHHYRYIRMAKLQNTKNTKYWPGCGATGLSFIASGNANGTDALVEFMVSYKSKHTLTIQSSSCAPWFVPRFESLYPHKNLHTNIYVVALFIIASAWKQPRCPLVSE